MKDKEVIFLLKLFFICLLVFRGLLFLNYLMVGCGVFFIVYVSLIVVFLDIFIDFKGWVNCGVVFVGFLVEEVWRNVKNDIRREFMVSIEEL